MQLVPTGDATLFHTHTVDNIPVVISGGKLRTELVGGETRDSSVVTGGISFAVASYTHRITNIGDTPLRFIDAEVLASPGSPANARHRWSGCLDTLLASGKPASANLSYCT